MLPAYLDLRILRSHVDLRVLHITLDELLSRYHPRTHSGTYRASPASSHRKIQARDRSIHKVAITNLTLDFIQMLCSQRPVQLLFRTLSNSRCGTQRTPLAVYNTNYTAIFQVQICKRTTIKLHQHLYWEV